jgi:signal transduction histidine kinase
MLELIEKNIGYSNKIINDLLDYSREVKLDLTENKPKNLVKEALSLIQAPNNVKIIDLTGNKPRIKADAEKIKRTFINIIRNAIDAMPKGGTLTIRNRQVDSVIEFVFSDTGVGMAHETLAKLWTPLFTTKAKGMGFGLPICKRIIEAHGGSIRVESVLRKGTTIVVTLPLEPEIPEEEGGEKIWVKTLESSLLTTTRT